MSKVYLSEIFKLGYGQNYNRTKLKLGKTILISSKGEYNGVFGYFNIKPVHKNVISVPRTGTICKAYYQPCNCCIDDNCLVLTPKANLSEKQMLFYSLLIRQEKHKYMYGRQVTPERLGRTLVFSVNSIPNWVDRAPIPDIPKKKPMLNKKNDFKSKTWKYFSIGKLFNLKKCRCSNASRFLKEGNDIDYIGAKKEQNGLMQKVKKIDKFVSKGNCIVFIGDGQGSVGLATYQPVDFIGSSTLVAGYNTNLNKYNALFFVTVLDLERYRYSFGRKYGKNQVENAVIKLPVDKKGNPDWQFMENYIKSLPYSSNLK